MARKKKEIKKILIPDCSTCGDFVHCFPIYENDEHDDKFNDINNCTNLKEYEV